MECGTSSAAVGNQRDLAFVTDKFRAKKCDAALAQLVERDLAKVEVTSSNLVCRSNFSVLYSTEKIKSIL